MSFCRPTAASSLLSQPPTSSGSFLLTFHGTYPKSTLGNYPLEKSKGWGCQKRRNGAAITPSCWPGEAKCWSLDRAGIA